MKAHRFLAGLASMAALAGCVTPSGGAAGAPTSFAAALAGAWDTRAQFDAAPETLKRPPAPGYPYDWIDRQSAVFAKVEAPALGDDVAYLEWRSGGPDGPISRQRLWAFRRDASGVRMDFYTLRNPSAFAGKAGDATAFRAITAADVIGYGPACALYVTPRGRDAFDAKIEPHECRIVAQSGRAMGISARVTLMPTGLLYSEAGVLDDEGYAFKVPGGPPYEFRRP